nr:helix-turn-helix transcriptional regulator [uncultured Caproiciproducens sp.]
MVARKLKELRTEHKLTQNEIATLLNISREAYCMYENEKRQLNYEALCFLADFYHVSLDYLFDRSDDPGHSEPMSKDEMMLLSYYRDLDERGRESILDMAKMEYKREMRGKKFSESAI